MNKKSLQVFVVAHSLEHKTQKLNSNSDKTVIKNLFFPPRTREYHLTLLSSWYSQERKLITG